MIAASKQLFHLFIFQFAPTRRALGKWRHSFTLIFENPILQASSLMIQHFSNERKKIKCEANESSIFITTRLSVVDFFKWPNSRDSLMLSICPLSGRALFKGQSRPCPEPASSTFHGGV